MNTETDALVLNSAKPIADSGKSMNWIFIVCEAFFLTFAFAVKIEPIFVGVFVMLGIYIGLVIINELHIFKLRKICQQKFYLENKIPYEELAKRLRPVVEFMGGEVAELKNPDTCPDIELNGWLCKICYNDDNSFLVKPSESMGINHITGCIRMRRFQGVLGYHVQRVCDHYTEWPF